MVAAGHEICSHGYRWLDYQYVDEATERADIVKAVAALRACAGSRPLGWYTGRTAPNTRRLVAEEGGFLYDADDYSDDLPFWTLTAGRPHLVVPYTLDANDMRFATAQGFHTGEQFFAYLRDAFDVLYAEGADGAEDDVGRAALPHRRPARPHRRPGALPRPRRGPRGRVGLPQGRRRPPLARSPPVRRPPFLTAVVPAQRAKNSEEAGPARGPSFSGMFCPLSGQECCQKRDRVWDTRGVGRRTGVVVATVLVGVLAACSGDHDAGQFGQRSTTTTSVPTSSSVASGASVATGVTTVPTTDPGASTTTVAATATTTSAAGVVRGTAVAGSAGGVETSGPPFTQTDPYSEAVRLADGSCVGWADSRGGSTLGLAVGSPVAVLDPTTNTVLGSGTVTASHWQDVSGGGNEWTCFFDFSAAVPNAPAEVLVRIGDLQPWTARPDPADPTIKVASVSTNASVGLIPSCPALPVPTTTVAGTGTTVATTTLPPATTVAAAPVTGWNAIGQYWSVGVDSLCKAGLPVTAIARPCRAPTVGSEYITRVVDSNDSTVDYTNGAAIPAGTAVTVVVATGRPCD